MNEHLNIPGRPKPRGSRWVYEKTLSNKPGPGYKRGDDDTINTKRVVQHWRLQAKDGTTLMVCHTEAMIPFPNSHDTVNCCKSFELRKQKRR